ncbi:hypothetical protein D1007_33264 [Hordeum vulgare]|nr:hypothetical protein D1007_33264 [Hordeum vulgare]
MRGSEGATVLDDLPKSIIVEEILVHLSPKYILHCRVVCWWWHSATSTDKFMLDNHRSQPLLPILSQFVDAQRHRLLFSFDAGAGKQQLCPVMQTYYNDVLHAALDGLLIVSHRFMFFIYNLVTRKCAPLAKPETQQGFYPKIVGFYRYQQSGGEYRVLWVAPDPECYKAHYTNYRTSYYVVAVGSDNTRYIGQGCIPQQTSSPPSSELVLRGVLGASWEYPPAHHHGSMHWRLEKYYGWDENYIMVFNTAAETFRLMCRPARLSDCLHEWLLEMDGTLALCSIRGDKHTIDVWVLQDYDAETWSFKHRINLTGVDPSALPKVTMIHRMAALNEGVLLVQFTCRRVLHFDIHGKFLGYVKSRDDQEIDSWITKHYHRGSGIPLPPSHEMREEDGANHEPPFFLEL